ncbi:MAG TPA: TRAP transporter small permease subunit [Geminicoccaceae bacterium]|nr:TRAP transporter small permease subunit [Geminicoccaceae bacterium]
MRALAAFVRLADAINRLVGRSVAWLILATVLVCAGVALSRYLLGFGRIWLQELYVVCFAIAFMLAAPYAYQADAHIRIEVLHQRWSPRARAWVEIAGCALFLIPWLALVFWSSLPFVRLSWLVREPSAQPGGLPGLYLVKTVIPVFAGLMLLQALAVVGRNVLRLAGRDDLLPPPGDRPA